MDGWLGISGYDWLSLLPGRAGQVFAHIAQQKRDDPIRKIRELQLEDLLRARQEGERPATLPAIEKGMIPGGGVQLESGEIPQFDVPTPGQERQTWKTTQVPLGMTVAERNKLPAQVLENLYESIRGKKEAPYTLGPGQKRFEGKEIIGEVAPKEEDSITTVYDEEGNPHTALKSDVLGTLKRAEDLTKVTPPAEKKDFPFPTLRGKKTPGKGLQHIREDRGDAYRQGTFNPETGEKKWDVGLGGDKQGWKKKVPAPLKPEKVSAQYDSWEKTIDRRFKQIGAKYKLSEAESTEMSGMEPTQILAALMSRKGLSQEAAQQYLLEIEDLYKTRETGLQDIEVGKDPYPRLKTIGRKGEDKLEDVAYQKSMSDAHEAIAIAKSRGKDVSKEVRERFKARWGKDLPTK